MKREKLSNLSERDLITGLIISDKFCQELLPIIKGKHFETEYARVIFGWVLDYYSKFRESPKKNIIKLYRSKVDTISDDSLLDNLLKFVEKLYENYENTTFNEDFLLTESIKYLKKRELICLQEDLDSLVSCGDIDKAETKLLNYKSLEKVSGKSISLLDKENVLSAFDEENDVLFTINGAFGDVIGDIHREDFISFLAPMKRGKSFALTQIGVEALKQGLNVLHVSLEMSEKQVLKRYWINLTGKNKDERENIDFSYFVEDGDKWRVETKKINRGGITLDDVEKKQALFKRIFRGADVKIYAVPAYSLTVESLETELVRLEENEDFIPDVIIVDYADIMKPTDKGEYRNQLDSIWKKLRGLAQSRKVALFTASQSNRSGLVKDAETQDIAEDVRKIAHVTSLVAINQTESEKKRGIVRFKQLAVREGEQQFKQAIATQCLAIGRMVTDSKFEDEVILSNKFENSDDDFEMERLKK